MDAAADDKSRYFLHGLINSCYMHVLETVIVIDTAFSRTFYINIQYKYNISVQQWQRSTGGPHTKYS
jgi:hypothetical protein